MTLIQATQFVMEVCLALQLSTCPTVIDKVDNRKDYKAKSVAARKGDTGKIYYRIELTPLFYKRSDKVQKETLIHEIAHVALFDKEDYHHGHNRDWKRSCKKIAKAHKISGRLACQEFCS